MKQKLLFFALLPLGNSVIAATCDVGYYLDNNECTSCRGGGYYCPGDDLIYPCPSTAAFDAAAAAAEPDLITITPYLASWNPTYGIVGCRARPYLHTNRGQYYYSVLYNETIGDYPFTGRNIKYWAIAAKGYYLTNHYQADIYYNVVPCTNAPTNAHYTGAGTPDVGNCPWECDSGFGKTSTDTCAELCTAGITEFHVGAHKFNIYAARHTEHTINIGYNNQVCYVSTATGAANDSLNFNLAGEIYHTTD